MSNLKTIFYPHSSFDQKNAAMCVCWLLIPRKDSLPEEIIEHCILSDLKGKEGQWILMKNWGTEK